jgi:hypothetical protein
MIKILNNMKSKILFLMVVTLVIMGLSGCEDDSTGGKTRITYFPILKINGDDVFVVNKGSNYVDPGYYAELNGKDVTSQVVVTSNVDVNKTGFYSVSYKITNEDGFFVTGSRTVIVNNPAVTTDISGSYTLDDGSYRLTLSSGKKTAFSGYTISISRITTGVFSVSDFLGGYYDKRANYGSSYCMTGYIVLNSDNTITLLSSHINGWGDALDNLKNGKYTPATNQIHWDVTYAGSYTWLLNFTKQ